MASGFIPRQMGGSMPHFLRAINPQMGFVAIFAQETEFRAFLPALAGRRADEEAGQRGARRETILDDGARATLYR